MTLVKRFLFFFIDIFPGVLYGDHDEPQANNLFRNIMHELVVAHL
jgi:hypothetical protein